MDIQKEKTAIQYLKLMGGGENDPYYLAYSGGKDSDVILALAKMAGVHFDAVHNLTTVDAPETVYHVRSHPEIIIERPSRTMWQLIVDKMIPPTMINRYCCSELKERGGQCRKVVTGVRWAESQKRRDNAGYVKIIGKPKTTQAKAEEIGAEYEVNKHGGMILNNDNDETRQLVEHCYKQSKVMINPIVEWTDADVWEFIRHYGIEVNPLYECGYKRVGCIGCPLASSKMRLFEFARYPKYKSNYIKAFERMIERRKETGKDNKVNWSTGESVFNWWLQYDNTQLKFEGFEDF
jgi:phosphoadenosine phosphosulfate reductase